jgi:hypothetical protein
VSEDLDVVRAEHDAATADINVAGAALHAARVRMNQIVQRATGMPDAGAPINFGDMGPGHEHGEAPPEYRQEYVAWIAAVERFKGYPVALTKAQAAHRTADTALAEADKQLADWRTELAQLERLAVV